jgi:hypothetical protein
MTTNVSKLLNLIFKLEGWDTWRWQKKKNRGFIFNEESIQKYTGPL